MIDLAALLSVLLFWGFQTGNIFFSLILSLFLGIPLLLNAKLKFSFSLFKFAVSVTYFLFFITIYYYINNNISFFLAGILKWSPLILLPVSALEVYGHDKKIPLKALLLFAEKDDNKIKILYYYIFFVVLASSTGRVTIVFYIFISVFFSVLLWLLKPVRYSYIKWQGILILLIFSSFVIQNGVSGLHKKLVDSMINFLMGINGNETDITKSSTRIGKIGRLKLSDKIVYRLKADKNYYPMYLRDATYIKYFSGDWVAPKSKFIKVNEKLCSYKSLYSDTLKAVLFGDFEKVSILPVNTKTVRVFRMKYKETYSKNSLMVIKREGPETDSISFEYYKNNISCLDKEFSRDDLAIPRNERIYIKLFIKKAGLSDKTPVTEVLRRLKSIFNTEYRYSLEVVKSDKIKSALGSFLIERKAGHCEYFATATTLILRELGIPARYTTGYSVQEYSELENMFIIRQRHAHAWVRVLVDNKWHNFDTTPSSWLEIENKNFAFYYKIYDFLSYIEYRFKGSAFWKFLKNNYRYSIIFLVIIFIIIRYKNRNRKNKVKISVKKDSKFLKNIDKVLKIKKIKRNKDIPVEIWLSSLGEDEKNMIDSAQLHEIISQYYIIRFSDMKLPANSLKLINKKIKKWKKSIKNK